MELSASGLLCEPVSPPSSDQYDNDKDANLNFVYNIDTTTIKTTNSSSWQNKETGDCNSNSVGLKKSFCDMFSGDNREKLTNVKEMNENVLLSPSPNLNSSSCDKQFKQQAIPRCLNINKSLTTKSNVDSSEEINNICNETINPAGSISNKEKYYIELKIMFDKFKENVQKSDARKKNMLINDYFQKSKSLSPGDSCNKDELIKSKLTHVMHSPQDYNKPLFNGNNNFTNFNNNIKKINSNNSYNTPSNNITNSSNSIIQVDDFINKESISMEHQVKKLKKESNYGMDSQGTAASDFCHIPFINSPIYSIQSDPDYKVRNDFGDKSYDHFHNELSGENVENESANNNNNNNNGGDDDDDDKSVDNHDNAHNNDNYDDANDKICNRSDDSVDNDTHNNNNNDDDDNNNDGNDNDDDDDDQLDYHGNDDDDDNNNNDDDCNNYNNNSVNGDDDDDGANLINNNNDDDDNNDDNDDDDNNCTNYDGDDDYDPEKCDYDYLNNDNNNNNNDDDDGGNNNNNDDDDDGGNNNNNNNDDDENSNNKSFINDDHPSRNDDDGDDDNNNDDGGEEIYSPTSQPPSPLGSPIYTPKSPLSTDSEDVMEDDDDFSEGRNALNKSATFNNSNNNNNNNNNSNNNNMNATTSNNISDLTKLLLQNISTNQNADIFRQLVDKNNHQSVSYQPLNLLNSNQSINLLSTLTNLTLPNPILQPFNLFNLTSLVNQSHSLLNMPNVVDINKPSLEIQKVINRNASSSSPFDVNALSPTSDDSLSFSPPSLNSHHDNCNKVPFPPKATNSKQDKICSKVKTEDRINASNKKELQTEIVIYIKNLLRPAYMKGKISKNEYKDILRKAVPRICMSNKLSYSKNKISNYIEAYVKKIVATKKYFNRKSSASSSAAETCRT